MKGVKAIAGFSVMIAILLLATPLSSGWESGQTWGYKWEVDWKEALNNHNNNTVFHGFIDGKTVHIFFVKYTGEEKGEYKFHYEGSFYSYGYIKGSVSHHSSLETTNGSMSMELKSLWINYEGDFHLVKVENSESFSKATYYGMKDISIHVYTKEPINMRMEEKYTQKSTQAKNSINMKTNLEGNIDINTFIIFQKPIPYLPDNSTPDFVSTQTSANYSGHWKVNTDGSINVSGFSQVMGANTSILTNVSLDKNTDTDFNGSLKDVFVMMSKHGDSVSRCRVLENIPLALTKIYPSPFTQNSKEINVSGFIRGVFILNHYAKYNGDFYSSVKEEGTTGCFDVNIHNGQYSDPATEKEVKSVENNAPAEYGTYQEDETTIPPINWIIMGTIVVVATVIVVAIEMVVKGKH